MENVMSPISAPAKPTAVFITSSKGGPGKSTLACLLLDYYRRDGIATAAYDADANNQTLLQHFGSRDLVRKLRDVQDPLEGVHVFNVRQPDERDILLNVVERKAARVVIDLPGGGGEDVAAVLPSSDDFFGYFEGAGILPVVVIVISNVLSSAASVVSTIQAFGKRPHYIVARNRHYGSSFPCFDGVEIDGQMRYMGAKNALGGVNGQEISVPAIAGETYARWDLASCSLVEAETHPLLSFADRARIRSWRQEFASAIAGTPLA